jgi:hypothetical protein
MFEWKSYVSAVERRRKAERHAASLKKKGHALSPVIASRGAIAKTFWGKSWCANLEGYSDYSNRLPRGRTYCRNGSVIDLKIAAGAVKALVCGSSLYQVKMEISDVPKAHWHAIGKDCAGSIDSLVELLQGHLSEAVMERICRKGVGLFPSPREIRFECSCPDRRSTGRWWRRPGGRRPIQSGRDVQAHCGGVLWHRRAARCRAGTFVSLAKCRRKGPGGARRCRSAVGIHYIAQERQDTGCLEIGRRVRNRNGGVGSLASGRARY